MGSALQVVVSAACHSQKIADGRRKWKAIKGNGKSTLASPTLTSQVIGTRPPRAAQMHEEASSDRQAVSRRSGPAIRLAPPRCDCGKRISVAIESARLVEICSPSI
jgi:hypothetical protein